MFDESWEVGAEDGVKNRGEELLPTCSENPTCKAPYNAQKKPDSYGRCYTQDWMESTQICELTPTTEETAETAKSAELRCPTEKCTVNAAGKNWCVKVAWMPGCAACWEDGGFNNWRMNSA